MRRLTVFVDSRPQWGYGKGEAVNNFRKCCSIGVTIAAPVILLCGLICPAHANVLDCISSPGGSGNSSGCTDGDRKHYEELQREAVAEAETEKAKVLYCINNPNAPTDKCPAEYRKIIQEVNAASMAKQQSEYEIWQQGAEARRQEVKAKQEALQKQELAEADKQQRAAAQERYDQSRRDAAQRLQEQQAALQRDVDDFSRRVSQSSADLVTQRAQQQSADQQARQIPVQRPPAALSAPVRRDPLAPAPAPSQTAESRRAAGLPDDPAAAACIQDDDCARALRSKQ